MRGQSVLGRMRDTEQTAEAFTLRKLRLVKELEKLEKLYARTIRKMPPLRILVTMKTRY